MAEDLDLLKQEEDELYCYKQCLKIAYYIAKVYNYVLNLRFHIWLRRSCR